MQLAASFRRLLGGCPSQSQAWCDFAPDGGAHLGRPLCCRCLDLCSRKPECHLPPPPPVLFCRSQPLSRTRERFLSCSLPPGKEQLLPDFCDPGRKVTAAVADPGTGSTGEADLLLFLTLADRVAHQVTGGVHG